MDWKEFRRLEDKVDSMKQKVDDHKHCIDCGTIVEQIFFFMERYPQPNKAYRQFTYGCHGCGRIETIKE